MAQAIKQLDTKFTPKDFSNWVYKVQPLKDGRIMGIMPYSSQINYFQGSRTHVEGMNFRNHIDAKKVVLDEDNTVIYNKENGIKVGLLHFQPEKGVTLEQMLKKKDNQFQDAIFNMPNNINDVINNNLPLLTGVYPWIDMPSNAPSTYVVYIKLDKGVFGRKKQDITVKITGEQYTPKFSIRGIDDPETVRRLINGFNTGRIKTGTYKISLDWVDNPMVMVRLDGYKPIFSSYHAEGLLAGLSVQKATDNPYVPLDVDVSPDKIQEAEGFYLDVDNAKSDSTYTSTFGNPLSRYIQGRFIERRIFYPNDLSKGVQITIPHMEMGIPADEKTEKQDIRYVPFSRKRSTKLSSINPYIGMIEVQISKVLTEQNSKIINFEPDTDQINRDEEEERREKVYPSSMQDTFLSSRGPVMKGGPSNNLLSFSTGHSEGFNWREIAGLTKKGSCEWVGDATAFRFIMTNKEPMYK